LPSFVIVLLLPSGQYIQCFLHILDSTYSKGNSHCFSVFAIQSIFLFPLCLSPVHWHRVQKPSQFKFQFLFRWLCQCARNQKHLALLLLPWLIGVPAKETRASISNPTSSLLPRTFRCRGVWPPPPIQPNSKSPIRLHLFNLHLQCRHHLFQLQSQPSSLLFINIYLPLLSSFSIVIMVIDS
jgi:hypothetical protein